ncbi:MAG: MFS transporter [Patescibacteria group bacterium]|mgnify:CR=1 FL=1
MINRVIRYLIAYDFVLNFAFGLLSPIFAIFVLQRIAGDNIRVVGTAISIYWLARILSTTPLSRFMDKTDGERDEFYFTIIGTIITSTVPILLIFADVPWHLYLIQFIHGLSNSMAVPGWRILFTDHIDKDKVGYEWSVEDIAIGIAVGSSGYLGALLADKFGFETVLILLAGLGYMAAILLVPLSPEFKRLKELRREHRMADIRHRREHAVHPSHHVK